MPSFSQVSILGKIGNDVSLKAAQKGGNYLHLSISVTKRFKLKGEGNNWDSRVRWIRVMFYGPYAVYAVDKVKKGDLVHVAGELEVSERMKDGKKTYDMYVLGKYLTPITRRGRDKADDNYGVPESEIDESFI